jgi:hypothetical protein
VGPERLALYPLSADLQPEPASGAAAVLASRGEPLSLLASGDHFEAANPWGTELALHLIAIVQTRAGASAARFDFQPGQASTYHDHRSYHGGQVGMAGDRHLELALVPAGGRSEELQLYLTDAYRQPVPLQGVVATATVNVKGQSRGVALRETGDCLTAQLDRSKAPVDVHLEIHYPGDPAPVEMDFYFEQ